MSELPVNRVLITGAAGFIGSHLADACVDAGMRVRAFVHYNALGKHGWLEHSAHRDSMEFHLGDVRDYDSVLAAAEGCDTIFHLAALIGIPYSYVSPLAYIRTNVEGTYNVLQAARSLNVPNVLITSTSETYGTAQYAPMDEKHPAMAQSPYAATKIAADQLAISFCRSFRQPVKIVRPFNTYGPRQSARAIIPTVILQLLAGRRRVALGNLNPTRDLTFVTDTVSAFMALARYDGFYGEPTNVGQGWEISVGDLARKIASIMGVEVEFDPQAERIRSNESEVERLLCDSTKLRDATGWKPEFDLPSGLEKTVSFLKNNQALYDANRYGI